jgi:ankyrin repeat protein
MKGRYFVLFFVLLSLAALASTADAREAAKGADEELLEAAAKGDQAKLQALSAHGAKVNATNEKGQSPLMLAS